MAADCSSWSRMISTMCSAVGIYLAHSRNTPSDKLSEAEQVRLREVRDKMVAEKILALVLKQKGYYIKLTQMLITSGSAPEVYIDVLGCLLEDCPPEDFQTIKGIVEKELGGKLTDHFSSFDEDPVGAASIGQAHPAILKDGTEVIVKVQYPWVEKYFRADFATITALISLDPKMASPQIKKIIDRLSDTFTVEFDYLQEAKMLQTCGANITPAFAKKVTIPQPLMKYTTKKVLTMEKIPGESVSRKTNRLLSMMASDQQITAQELREKMKEEMKDPAKLEKYVNAKATSTLGGAVGLGAAKTYAVMTNAKNLARSKLTGTKIEEKFDASVFMNGPKLSKIIADFHAHQIFFDGLFNSDPHAGNVIVKPDGVLGLVDYGAAVKLTEHDRRSFAQLVVSICDGDDEGVIAAFGEMGFKSEKNSREMALAYAYMSFHRGINKEDLMHCGVPEEQCDMMHIDLYLLKQDSLLAYPESLLVLQRCAWEIRSIAMDMGAGNVSASLLFRQTAFEYLKHTKANPTMPTTAPPSSSYVAAKNVGATENLYR